MNSRHRLLFGFFAFLLLSSSLTAQQTTPSASAVVPRLVNFSSKAVNAQGKVISGIAGVTFAIYQEESGGTPLWLETQNVQADTKGNYTVQLGANKPEGLPLDLFASGEARWLGVTVNGGQEQPRVLLLSVPYALKAADAQTLGGLPASAFVLAAPVALSEASSAGSVAPSANPANLPSAATRALSDVTTSGGTVNALPLFSTATNIQNSLLTQTGTTALNVAGALNLPATGVATATAGKNSQPATFTASVFNSNTKAAVSQNFRWQAEPSGNDTATPAGSLNLLYASGTNALAETGLKIGPRGVITFVPAQTFPIPNAGVTNTMLAHPSLSVNTGVGLTGGGTVPLGGATTLNLNTSEVPLLAAANLFTNNQAISAGTSTWGLTVSQPSYQTILTQGPLSGVGTAIEMQTTGTNGMSWQILNTGALSSQGSNKLNFRNDSAGVEVMTLTASGQVGIGTTSPTATLDVQGNVTQARTAGGMVKAMLHFSPFNSGRIISCFNSTLSGAAATTPPCGFTFDITGAGDYIFDFGFEVDDRIYSATSGTQSFGTVGSAIVVSACGNQDGQCLHTGSLTNNQMEVAAFDSSTENFIDSKIHLIIY